MMKYFEVHFYNMEPVYYQSREKSLVTEYLNNKFWDEWTTITEIECSPDLKFEYIKYV